MAAAAAAAFTSISPPIPPLLLLPSLPVTSSNLTVISPHHSAQIRGRALRLNLTPISPPSRLVRFHNSLIRSFTSLSLHSLSLSLFLSLLSSDLSPNEFTFPFVLKSSTRLDSLAAGRQIHAHLAKSGLLFANVFCDSALLDLYVKIGSLGDAVKMFDRMPERSSATWNSMVSAFVRNGSVETGLDMLDLMESLDVDVGPSSWNSVIAGCIQLGEAEMAMRVFGQMVRLMRPNLATFNTLLSVISDICRFDWLKELHGFAIRNLHVVDVGDIDEERLWSAIAAGYAVNGAMDCASQLFEGIRLRNSQLGNSMISGFLNRGRSDKSFDAFREMAAECIREAVGLPYPSPCAAVIPVRSTLRTPSLRCLASRNLPPSVLAYRSFAVLVVPLTLCRPCLLFLWASLPSMFPLSKLRSVPCRSHQWVDVLLVGDHQSLLSQSSLSWYVELWILVRLGLGASDDASGVDGL